MMELYTAPVSSQSSKARKREARNVQLPPYSAWASGKPDRSGGETEKKEDEPLKAVVEEQRTILVKVYPG